MREKAAEAWQWLLKETPTIRSWPRKWWSLFKTHFAAAPDYVDWLASLVEGLLVLCIGVGILVAASRLFFSDKRTIDVAFVQIDKHWRASLVIVIPLFHKTVKTLLLNIKEAAGISFHGGPAAPVETHRNPGEQGGAA